MQWEPEITNEIRPDIRYGEFKKFRECTLIDPKHAYRLSLFVPPREVCNQIIEKKIEGGDPIEIAIPCVGILRSNDLSKNIIMQIPVQISIRPSRGPGKILINKINRNQNPGNLNWKTIREIFQQINKEMLNVEEKYKHLRPKRAQGWSLKTCPVCFRRFEQHRPDQKVCSRMACRKAMYRHPRSLLHAWEIQQEWYILARSGQSIIKKPY